MSVAAQVDKLDRLRKKLAKMPELARVEIRKALDKGAEEVLRAQRTLAATSRRTGALIGGLHAEDGEHDLQVKVVSSAFYSRYVEFGTSHSAAEPFFFPGYRLVKKRVKARIARAARAAAKKVANGGR